MTPELVALMAGQRAYYAARAPTYDDWWQRNGIYDEGDGRNAAWTADVEALQAWLGSQGRLGRCIELAGGTGLWTTRLGRQADELLVVDASREVLTLNRARGHPPHVRFRQADIFALEPLQQFDTVFFGFWLNHVPNSLRARFWALVRGLLRPGGRALFVDSAAASTIWRFDESIDRQGDRIQQRELDGAVFGVVKQPLAPDDVRQWLCAEGWWADVAQTNEFFIHGRCEPAAVEVVALTCTCDIAPVQFEGRTRDDRPLYIRQHEGPATVCIGRPRETMAAAVQGDPQFLVPLLAQDDARNMLDDIARWCDLTLPDHIAGL
ncbi:class I SAM-dependent methyltransferase [Sandaracinobacteroides saxicola]|uniref:Class I SAM-dependent methyltransferase n=1 Tax=Sandaracinobacteroides saxicola TaxID=2759707 RepID=A0A7G5IKP3_9SPHN|nr:class I SAM-dependent methyltransferase [Sandaracinobacteroides saxicola]QMW23935.1 class I SAM-dependent methyltransferase [Sandaracinobacteroides saxicola]